jgi:hypothetical protein
MTVFKYFSVRRNRTNCIIRWTRFNLAEFDNIDAGYCLDNEAVCFAGEMK